MGIGGGYRHLINDKKPEGTEAAFVHSLIRNTGIKDLNI
jgi:hypothetical protein